MRTNGPVVFEGQRTPWGKADHARVIVPGIGIVGTPGHGGIKLDRAHQAKVPSYLKRDGGWYEEDIDWAIPYVLFAEKLNEPAATAHAVRTLIDWLPDEYERFTGTVVTEDQSHVKRERAAEARAVAAGAYKVVSAVSGPRDWSRQRVLAPALQADDVEVTVVRAGAGRFHYAGDDPRNQEAPRYVVFSKDAYNALRAPGPVSYPYIPKDLIEERAQ